MAVQTGPLQRWLAPIATAGEHRVTTFELFFDLVYVFAFTQVSQYMAGAHSALGVLQGMLVFALLWWSWSSYAWLGNQTLADQGVVRVGMSVALIAVFVVALVVPESFDDHAGGLSGTLVFVIAYVVVRVVHVVLYLAAAGDDRGLRRQILVASTAMLSGFALLLVGALVGGPAQTWWWLAGFGLDFVLTFVTSRGGDWRIQSAAHWAERYGLIVILALGESIVAIGVGVAQEPVSVAILTGAVLSILLSLALWWLYFDVIADAAEQRLATLATARERAAVAAEGYTYLHVLLVAGVLLAALGVEEGMHDVGSGEAFGWFGAWALFGGVALYLGAHGAFWRRVGGTWKPWRMSTGALLLVLVPVAAVMPPLADLALVVAVVGALVATEARPHRAARASLRAHPEHGPGTR